MQPPVHAPAEIMIPYRMVWTAASPRWTRQHLDDDLDIYHLPDPTQRASNIEYLAEATGK